MSVSCEGQKWLQSVSDQWSVLQTEKGGYEDIFVQGLDTKWSICFHSLSVRLAPTVRVFEYFFVQFVLEYKKTIQITVLFWGVFVDKVA